MTVKSPSRTTSVFIVTEPFQFYRRDKDLLFLCLVLKWIMGPCKALLLDVTVFTCEIASYLTSYLQLHEVLAQGSPVM